MTGIALFGAAVMASAQSANPLTISSGFNADVIANGSGSASSSTTSTVDTPTDGNVFYDSTYASSHGISGGALNGGTLSTSLGYFAIASVSGNNALDFQSSGTGTLTLASPATASQLYVLGTAGNGPTIVDYIVNFAGGATTSGSLTFPDWNNTAQTGTVNGLGRVDVNTGAYDTAGNVFSLYSESISIASANQSHNVDSISFSYSSGGESSIFAISSVAPVPEPSTMALTGLCGVGLIFFRRRK